MSLEYYFELLLNQVNYPWRLIFLIKVEHRNVVIKHSFNTYPFDAYFYLLQNSYVFGSCLQMSSFLPF